MIIKKKKSHRHEQIIRGDLDVRITGGSARGRKLLSPKTELIRPTCDRVREALFNILGERVQGAHILDCFAGTGAFGIEALSRGAASALFLDQSLEAGRLIEMNLRATLAHPRVAFARVDLTRAQALASTRDFWPAQGFNIIFMDPPYRKDFVPPLLQAIDHDDMLAEGGMVVAEEHFQVDLPAMLSQLSLTDHRRYGETGLWFFKRHNIQTP